MRDGRYLDIDEDDVRVRARGGSRPRTRKRPKHENARLGFVTAVNRGRYQCLVGDLSVVAMKARELGRGSIVVGDIVALVGDLSGRPGTLARIVRVEKRSSVLRRTADDTDPVERVIVANADQMVIVTALADPDPQPRFIDRCLVAAYEAGLDPLLCLTKSDLASPDALLDIYAPLGLRWVVTRRDGDLSALREQLMGRISVLVGPSGVGKSTLVNLLVPEARRAVGDVNVVTGRGRHTSTSAVALPIGAPASAESVERLHAAREGRIDRSELTTADHRHAGGAASGWHTSPRTTCSRPSPTWTTPWLTARTTAPIWATAAPSMNGWLGESSTRPGSPRSAACSPAAKASLNAEFPPRHAERT